MEHAVVIPTYNAERFIVGALESVRQQTLAASEVIVVDDGSTDHTVGAVKAWSNAHDLPVVLQQIDNAGAGAARNHALKKVTADWISFLDADDEWAPEKLERVDSVVSGHESVDFVHTDRVYVLPSGERSQSGFQADRMTDRQHLCSGFSIKTSTVSIARDFLHREALEFGIGRTSEDYALFWRTVIRARDIEYIDEALTHVNERQGSLTRADNESALILDNIEVLATIIEYEPQSSRRTVDMLRALSRFRYRLAQQVFLVDSFSPAAFTRNTIRLRRSIGTGQLIKVLASVALPRRGRKTGVAVT